MTNDSLNRKSALAGYLVNLSTLLQHQDRAGGNLPSKTLARDYQRAWDDLKGLILAEEEAEQKRKEKENEAGQS
jgi:hypothetical protein